MQRYNFCRQSGLPDDSGDFSGGGCWQVLPWTRGVRDSRGGGSPQSGAYNGGRSYRQAMVDRIGPSDWRIPAMGIGGEMPAPAPLLAPPPPRTAPSMPPPDTRAPPRITGAGDRSTTGRQAATRATRDLANAAPPVRPVNNQVQVAHLDPPGRQALAPRADAVDKFDLWTK